MNDNSVTPFFDREGAKTEFGWQCIKCKIQEMIDKGLRGKGRVKYGDCFCKVLKKDCPWIQTSSPGKNKDLCTAPSAYFFKKYGFDVLKKNSTYIIGKCHFLFYMYHLQGNWMPPQDKPKRNRFGKIINWETESWTMAHLNGCHWDDSRINLAWMLSSEHGILEPNTKRITEITSLKDVGIL